VANFLKSFSIFGQERTSRAPDDDPTLIDPVSLYLARVHELRAMSCSSRTVAIPPILLQKSKVADLRIFRENTKREAIADSCNLNRVTEVACEFNVRRWGPSHLYTKTAPIARRIF